LGIGRIFRIRELASFEIRGEWFNALNRTQMPNPSAGNPLQTPAYNAQGVPTAGFGRIDSTTATGQRNVNSWRGCAGRKGPPPPIRGVVMRRQPGYG
jgi:hypothetical protein